MSNHFSADNLKFPGDDRRLDLTDVFAFTAPHDPDTTVLIIDSNPTSAPPPIPAPVTGVWASISRRRSDGTLEQLDRGGNPTINPVINPDGEKNLFNSRQPADDVANYLQPWTEILQNAGGYSPDQARAAALQVLPDILRYDRTVPAAGRMGREAASTRPRGRRGVAGGTGTASCPDGGADECGPTVAPDRVSRRHANRLISIRLSGRWRYQAQTPLAQRARGEFPVPDCRWL